MSDKIYTKDDLDKVYECLREVVRKLNITARHKGERSRPYIVQLSDTFVSNNLYCADCVETVVFWLTSNERDSGMDEHIKLHFQQDGLPEKWDSEDVCSFVGDSGIVRDRTICCARCQADLSTLLTKDAVVDFTKLKNGEGHEYTWEDMREIALSLEAHFGYRLDICDDDFLFLQQKVNGLNNIWKNQQTFRADNAYDFDAECNWMFDLGYEMIHVRSDAFPSDEGVYISYRAIFVAKGLYKGGESEARGLANE